MINNKKLLAIVPARCGSKGIPGKNIKHLNGKPLIAWTIESAKRSKYVDRVIVSTDDTRIADISRRYGAEAPFVRPWKLASDNAKMMDVVLHCVKFLHVRGEYYEIILLLQPTSPLRCAGDIDDAAEYFIRKKAQAVVSVAMCEHSPELAGKLPDNRNMSNFIPRKIGNKNRQQLDAYYRVNGAIYMAETNFIRKKRNWYGARTFAYIMEKQSSVDIDDLFDFSMAECLLKSKNRIRE